MIFYGDVRKIPHDLGTYCPAHNIIRTLVQPRKTQSSLQVQVNQRWPGILGVGAALCSHEQRALLNTTRVVFFAETLYILVYLIYMRELDDEDFARHKKTLAFILVIDTSL